MFALCCRHCPRRGWALRTVAASNAVAARLSEGGEEGRVIPWCTVNGGGHNGGGGAAPGRDGGRWTFDCGGGHHHRGHPGDFYGGLGDDAVAQREESAPVFALAEIVWVVWGDQQRRRGGAGRDDGQWRCWEC